MGRIASDADILSHNSGNSKCYYSFASQKHIYKLVVAAKLEKVHLIGQLVYIALSDWLDELSATFSLAGTDYLPLLIGWFCLSLSPDWQAKLTVTSNWLAWFIFI